MNRRRLFRRSLTIDKPSKLSLQETQQLSTFRTKFTRGSLYQSRNNDINEVPQTEESPKAKLNTIEDDFSINIAMSLEYSTVPVSMISVWSQKQYLRTIQQQLWLGEDRKLEGKEPCQFQIIKGKSTASFVQFTNFYYQTSNENQNRLLMQYVLSNLIFLFVRYNDTETMNRMLKLCETISDLLLYNNQKQKSKPQLIICRIISDQQDKQEKWNGFLTRLTSWKHFPHLQIYDVESDEIQVKIKGQTQTDSQNEFEDKNRLSRCCRFMREMIRYHQKPQRIYTKIMIGNVWLSFREKLLASLSQNLYTNVDEIYQQTIRQNTEIFKRTFNQKFRQFFTQKLKEAKLLKKLNFYKGIFQAKAEVEKLFNNAEIYFYKEDINLAVRQQLLIFREGVIKQQHTQNSNLLEKLKGKYLNYRPLSLIKCKKMMAELLIEHINDTRLQDLFEFFVFLIETFADELAWGDELNALNIKDKRVDALISTKAAEIETHNQKVRKLISHESARSKQFNQKSLEFNKNFKHKLTRKESIQRATTLQLLIFSKVNGQKIRVLQLQNILRSISYVTNIKLEVQKKQKVFQSKELELKRLRRELQLIEKKEAEEMREKKRRLEEERISKEGLEKQRLMKQQSQREQVELKRSLSLKKKKSSCGCFGV